MRKVAAFLPPDQTMTSGAQCVANALVSSRETFRALATGLNVAVENLQAEHGSAERNQMPSCSPLPTMSEEPEDKTSHGPRVPSLKIPQEMKRILHIQRLSLIYLLVVSVLLISPTLGDMGIYMTDFDR
ncbi:hypothetical protein DUI87_03920 [Hirundo rustica rustica]|uniref:Uncharacterized protein n=1 Tax=Hirundo rustica rustica TaxID=333673 RepID=A0A3M0L188_HIRRU|nr:hypothetical protein DUI87_03920 [Hirundo rustica rustica]